MFSLLIANTWVSFLLEMSRNLIVVGSEVNDAGSRCWLSLFDERSRLFSLAKSSNSLGDKSSMAFPLKFNSRRFESFIKLDRSMLWNKFNKNCQLVIVNGIVKLRGVRHFKFCFDFIKTIDFNRPFRRTKSLKLIYKYKNSKISKRLFWQNILVPLG